MNKVIVRTISGVIYIALIVGAIFGGGVCFAALMSVFAVLGTLEFGKVLGGGAQMDVFARAATVVDLLAAAAIVWAGVLTEIPTALIYTLIGVVLLYLPVRFTLALYDKSSDAFARVSHSVLSLVYIALPLLMLTLVFTDKSANLWLVLAAFIMIWLNDTGAFCVGSLIGRRRLFERLSPKKSWEGFFGGLVCCLLAGVLFYFELPQLGYSLPVWLALGAIVCLLSTWGDLFESLFKRSSHVKDSGHLIPGHGGILDRIDSLLFVSMGLFVFNLFTAY
ncbi:MAG: phosphatidate cytidylyltransferase [Muribaculaceae bacterium]|nr:phosphatidate cytidylyltransferase [Muribaculaceae bacterium]